MLTKCTEVDDYVAKLHTYDFSWILICPLIPYKPLSKMDVYDQKFKF